MGNIGTRLDFSTGCRIRTPEEWDSAGECVKRDVKGALAANEILRRCRDTMELVFRYYEVNEIIPSVREVTESYKARNPVVYLNREDLIRLRELKGWDATSTINVSYRAR